MTVNTTVAAQRELAIWRQGKFQDVDGDFDETNATSRIHYILMHHDKLSLSQLAASLLPAIGRSCSCLYLLTTCLRSWKIRLCVKQLQENQLAGC